MIAIWHHSRPHKGRIHPSFDLLEDRVALAGGGEPGQPGANSSTVGAAADVAVSTQGQPFSVNLVDPAPGFVFHDSPSTLTLQFNNPIFPGTLSTDVGIIQTDGAGNPTGWYIVPDPDQLTLDDSATLLSVNVGQTLPPGHYQVWVFGTSGITDIDGDLLVPDGNNLILGGFDVTAAGVTLADATDLPTPGPTIIDVPGTLDFQTDPYAVSLYRIQLDPGQFWRLGLEVTAQRDGSSLDTALALFDEAGQPIATDEFGRKDDPKDPFLFAGLQPGTYYIGVSGTENLPGMPGGYDPVTGSPGSLPQIQAGGIFTLHVVADPVDTPPELLSLIVNHADSRSTSPTGLTLDFSRTISLPGQLGDLSPALDQGITVTDGAGRTWPVQASGYDEADSSVSYLFVDPLPPGYYTVQLPPQTGLVDLAGLSPVAPGEPAGVLGGFDVSPESGSESPLDLGAILPGAAADGRSIELSLQPGQVVTYRLVMTVPAIYQFEFDSNESALSAQLTGAGATYSIDPGGTNDTQLVPGEYSIRIENAGTREVDAQLYFRASITNTELFLAGGVGQGPGLSLRLISHSNPMIQPSSESQILTPILPLAPPLFVTPAAAPPTSSEIDPGARNGAGTASLPLPSLSSDRSPTASVVALSFLGMGSDLIGRPSQVGLHGPSSEPGLTLPNEVTSLGGVTQGQQLSISREDRVTRDVSQPEAIDLISRVFQLQNDLTAADDGVDSGRAVSLVSDVSTGPFVRRRPERRGLPRG